MLHLVSAPAASPGEGEAPAAEPPLIDLMGSMSDLQGDGAAPSPGGASMNGAAA